MVKLFKCMNTSICGGCIYFVKMRRLLFTQNRDFFIHKVIFFFDTENRLAFFNTLHITIKSIDWGLEKHYCNKSRTASCSCPWINWSTCEKTTKKTNKIAQVSFCTYSIVASSNAHRKSTFFKRSQYIRIKNPFHNQRLSVLLKMTS